MASAPRQLEDDQDREDGQQRLHEPEMVERIDVDAPQPGQRRHGVVRREVQPVQDRGGDEQRDAETAQLLAEEPQRLTRTERPVGVHQAGQEGEERHPDVDEQIGELAIGGAIRHVQPGRRRRADGVKGDQQQARDAAQRLHLAILGRRGRRLPGKDEAVESDDGPDRGHGASPTGKVQARVGGAIACIQRQGSRVG